MANLELPPVMKAQHLDAYNTPYILRTIPLPEPTEPYDILIKVDAASYCHTDAVLAAGLMKPNPPHFPLVGSHEFAGTIVSLPSNSKSIRKIGDRVGVPGRSFHPCGSCFECMDTSGPDADPAGYSVYCPNSHNCGLSADGGFREYAVVDSRQVAPMPDELTAVETAPLMCAGITVFAALRRCGLREGGRVGIMGAGGGLGHLGLQFAKKMGYRVIGVDNADGAIELAESLNTGARIVDARKEEANAIRESVGKEDGKSEKADMGLDAVIILPESQRAFDYGVGMLRNHGKCVVVSFPTDGFRMSSQDIVFRDITFCGSLVGSNRQLTEMLQFAADHHIRAVVKSYPLTDLNALVEEYHKGKGGKLVVDMAL